MASALFSINHGSLATSLGVARKELELVGVKTKDLSSLEVITYRMAWDALRRAEQSLEQEVLLVDQIRLRGKAGMGSTPEMYFIRSGPARSGIASVMPSDHPLNGVFQRVRHALITIFGEAYKIMLSEKQIDLAWAIKNDPLHSSAHAQLMAVKGFIGSCVMGTKLRDEHAESVTTKSTFASISILSLNKGPLERLVAQAKEELSRDKIATEGLTPLEIKIYHYVHKVLLVREEKIFQRIHDAYRAAHQQREVALLDAKLPKLHSNRLWFIQQIAERCKEKLTEDEINFLFVTEWDESCVSSFKEEDSFSKKVLPVLRSFWVQASSANGAAASRK